MSGRKPKAPAANGPADKSPVEGEALATFEEQVEHFYQLVATTQALMHRREPQDEVVRNLRERYPVPSRFLECSRFMLMESGLPRLDAFYYTMIPGLTRAVMRDKNGVRPDLRTASKMAEYLKALFIGVRVECFYLVALNYYGRLIDTVLMQKGTADSAPFYLRPMLSTVIHREARYIVLCHNHPGGTLRPSREDLMCTLRALNAVIAMGVPMLDHIIIARNRAVSIRGSGLIPGLLWTIQAPKNRLMREWLDVDLPDEE